MSQPGTSGWVCIETNDGESYCQKFSRRLFETANTLAAPGELCTPNYLLLGSSASEGSTWSTASTA